MKHIYTLTPNMMHLTENMVVFWKDRNRFGGKVALLIHQSLSPESIIINTPCEVVAVKISLPTENCNDINIQAFIYTNMFIYTKKCLKSSPYFEDMPVCVMGDFNEDILLLEEKHCCAMFKSKCFSQLLSLLKTVEH